MSQTAVLIIATASAIMGLIAGYFITRLVVQGTQVSGILYVDSSEPDSPAIYTTLSEDPKTYKNGAFKLFLVRRIKP